MKKSILIVDDLPDVAYTVKYGLEKLDSPFDIEDLKKRIYNILN